jgi:ABC toxin N-terminal region/Neuraminidase-like domain
MKIIISPIKPDSPKPDITNLQTALLLLLERTIVTVNAEERPVFLDKLRQEQQEQRYADVTRRLVTYFQEQQHLHTTGEVDEPTAERLNTILRELGAFDTQQEFRSQRIISGRVMRSDRQPFSGTVRAFHLDERGSVRLGDDQTDTDGKYTIRYESLPEFGAINLRVSVLDDGGKTAQESDVVRDAAPLQMIDVVVPFVQPAAVTRLVEGRIVFDHGAPAEGLTLRLYRLGFGGAEGATRLAETTSREHGVYSLNYTADTHAANLEVRGVDAAGQEIALSKMIKNATEREVLNLVAPAQAQPVTVEFTRLANDLQPHVGDLSRLRSARETAQQQDLTLLHEATGWDARLIATAALATRLSVAEETGLPQDALYGLLRAGLPSDKLKLARVSAEAFDLALGKARASGIVNLSDAQVAQVKQSFETFSVKTRLAMQAPGSRATYGDLLKKLELSENDQQAFAKLYLNHRGDGKSLWEKATNAGLGSIVPKLQKQGKLAFLTTNNPDLTAKLQSDLGEAGPEHLAKMGLYKKEKWLDRIDAIPPAYADGVNPKDSYAEDMARRVRISYSTEVTWNMIETGELTIQGGNTNLSAFFKNAIGKGFKLGQTPVDAFIKANPEVLNDIAEVDRGTTTEMVKTLQRVYQITPSNDAMKALLNEGLLSAQDVLAYPLDVFLERFAHLFPSEEQARLVYRKAEQVSNITISLFSLAKELDVSPPVFALSASPQVRQDAKTELIKKFPTMESLFGSLDFCECEHCRSVLSPAAYLVDLLQFLDRERTVWENFLKDWKIKHSNAPYPFKNQTAFTDAGSPANTTRTPYEILIERRPDLPYIPLTCENTNTALPQIDLVNEILEYYVANKALKAEAARDTGAATTAELLAEPQNVIREAYDKLREARYPLNLPFDLWIETVRRFCNYFETPLYQVLEAFRGSDELFAPAQPFDRASIFMESLGLSPVEVAVFTDPAPLLKWHELYGFETAAQATTDAIDATTGQRIDLNSAKALSRRLGVTYKEIADIVRTSFVNPRLTELALLYKLGVAIQDARFYTSHKNFYEQNKDLVGKNRGTLPPADQQRFDQLSKQVPNTKMTGWEVVNEVAAFERRLNESASAFSKPLNELQTHIQNIPFDKVLVLADPDAGCNFDQTTLQYADGRKAAPIDFLRVNLFVRLWRKRGWSIEETDRALSTFIPQSAPFDENPENLKKQPLKTALIYLAHLKTLADKVSAGNQSRLKLLTLWSDIVTTGRQPLYAQLFLTRTVLKTGEVDVVVNGDPRRISVFDDPFGHYLLPAGLKNIAEQVRHQVRFEGVKEANQVNVGAFAGEPRISLRYDPLAEVQYLAYQGVLTDTEKTQLLIRSPSDVLSKLLDAVQVKAKEFTLIKGHVLAIQGALGLTADEILRILEDSGKSLDTAELSLPNVSLLYRYGLLAKALKMSVRELITVKQLSGLDPFKLLHPDPLAKIEEDHPFSQTLRFVAVAEEINDSGLRIDDLDYLLRHRFDAAGKYRSNRQVTLGLLKTLAKGIRAIRVEHAVPDDPGALSDEVLRQKLGLVLPPNVVERLLSMMSGTVEFTIARDVASGDQLYPADFVGEPAISRLTYNGASQKQEIVFRGVLFDAQKSELKARFDAKLNSGQKAAFAGLLDAVQAEAKQQANEFFVKHLKKQALIPSITAGFLEKSDFDSLFAPLPEIADNLTEDEKIAARKANEEQRKKKLTILATAFFPFLQQCLIRQFILETLTAHTVADPVLVESLLTDERLLKGGEFKPLLGSFEATGLRGVSAIFFDSDDLQGLPQGTTPVVHSSDTALKDTRDAAGNSLNPANSARFAGHLEVPRPGAYRFYIELSKQAAEAELRFEHLSNPVFLKGVADTNNKTLGDKPNEYLELKAGVLYRFSLELKKLGGGRARLLVQGETLPKDDVSQLTLYPLSAMAGAESAILLLTKALQIVQGLGLSEREIRYLVTHAADFGDVNLSQMPIQTVGDTPAEKVATTQRFTGFLRLAAYARLKRNLAGGTDDLVGVFEANETGDLDKVYSLIAALTRRDEAAVKVTAKALVATPSFKNEELLLRVWETLQVVERFGVPMHSLLEWTRIVGPSTTAEQRFEIARGVKEAIKTRFEPEMWQRVAQPIFDKLRQSQRDALVARVMHERPFDRLEQLFEFFLIDPGVEPVVQTSRIRAAIAAVQIFIHRCLLNLEPQVAPSAINSKQWQWMKRYPVWAGNRKLWLFPENVLEPEFRDDKTHLFAELEGRLLQSDVTNDVAEDAFFQYLKKLDELARLDIVAMYCEEQPLDPASNQLHVIGRTYAAPHKYFYRRYAHQMWTPWEPMPVEIEGDHIVPVVWRDRLNVFWVTFMDQADPDQIPLDETWKPRTSTDFPVDGSKKEVAFKLPGGTDSSKKVTEMSVGQLAGGVRSAVRRKLVKVQLHWSEYLQREWSVRESGGYSASLTKSVPFNFDSAKVFIHATKDYDGDEERSVKIHLGGEINQAFSVVSRNSRPTGVNREPSPQTPYNTPEVQANRYVGNGAFKVTFAQRIETQVGEEVKTTKAMPDILQEGGQFTLLPCANTITVGSGEIASLVTPIFYEDSQSNTFYVEPTFRERTIEEWQEWVTRTPEPEVEWNEPDWWDKLHLSPMVPKHKVPVPVDPRDPIWRPEIGPRARFEVVSKQDWVANPETVMQFDGELIGPTGRAGLAIQSSLEPSSALEDTSTVINVNAGSAIAGGQTVVAVDNNALASAGLTRASRGLNVIGGDGLNSALLKNLNSLKGF